MEMNEIKIYENAEFGQVRTLEIDGEPWFVGKDVAEILGYANSRKAITDHIDEEDKGVTKCYTLGGTQEIIIINESGMYSLIISSKLPKAKEFKRWVTSEVLPSIRKRGLYATEDLINNPDLAIKAFQALKEERERTAQLQTTVKKLEQINGELRAKADYTDVILKNKGLVTITQIAKDYGMSGKKMNKLLNDLGVQYKQSSQWLLYRKYHDKGYTHSETVEITRANGSPDIVMETKWTQKGWLFLYELLKSVEILPMIEEC